MIAAEMYATASGIVELHAAREPALGDERGREEQQLVLLSRREFHRHRRQSVRCSRCAGSPRRGPRSSGRSKRHSVAKYVRAALAESPR